MLIGRFIHSLDAKGRLSIPAKLRKYIAADQGDTIVMTKGVDKCIELYPLSEWQTLQVKLKSLEDFNPQDRRFVRTLLNIASEDTMDAQSRILIPQALLQYAQIETEVLILGTLKTIELWNPKLFDEYMNSSTESFEQIATNVMKR